MTKMLTSSILATTLLLSQGCEKKSEPLVEKQEIQQVTKKDTPKEVVIKEVIEEPSLKRPSTKSQVLKEPVSIIKTSSPLEIAKEVKRVRVQLLTFSIFY